MAACFTLTYHSVLTDERFHRILKHAELPQYM